MDLLFKRYASPFILFDGMLESCRFCEFVNKLIDIKNDEDIYHLWIHKVYDKSYQDFKDDVISSSRPVNPVNLGATIRESESILQGFIPEG